MSGDILRRETMQGVAWRDWRDWRVLAAVVAILVSMVTLDGLVASIMRSIGQDTREVIKLVMSSGNSKYSLMPTGVGFIVCMVLYFFQASTVRARIYAWLAGAFGFVFVSIAFSGILVNVMKIVVGRARPGIVEPLSWPVFEPITLSSRFHSIPSGHTDTFFCIAVAVGFFMPRLRVPMLVLAAALSFGRVLQFRHFISDIAAGALLAVLTTLWLRHVFARRNIVFCMSPEGNIRFTAAGRYLLNSKKSITT